MRNRKPLPEIVPVKMEWLAAFFSAMVPNEHAPPRTLYFWRVRVGVLLSATFIGFVFSQAIAYGLVPAIAPGFAQSAAMEAAATRLEAGQNKIRLQLINRDLLMDRVRNCQAKSGTERQLWWEQIQGLLAEREQLTGKSNYTMPDCSSLQ
ncbi:hypothetical protein UFOVP119_47 [uncultured Caudovirales phage]|uniref:Uncharacterized protein n=1 Tax=uncultured Caudovirales phage TaxID=2100421 RepID=A0A6J5LAV5_9CAUD|nr:hypothetical protein UFOVP119_47 [uncultured Caudovirales phage]